MKKVTVLRALLIIGLVMMFGSGMVLWWAFHLSGEGRDMPDLINVGMILGVIGICCTTSFIWLWVRGLIMRTNIVKSLLQASRDKI